jgi:hypothetical protein
MHTFSTTTAKADSTCTTCLSISTLPSVTLQNGSALQTQCLCDLGYYGANGGTCTACEVGKYKNVSGTASCSICEANKYQPLTAKTAATDCIACPSAFALSPAGSSAVGSCECAPGYFGLNGDTCNPCYAGQYKTIKGTSSCDSCVIGKYSTASAATASSTCIACHNNTVSVAGSAARTQCHCVQGYYTKDLGTLFASCIPCTAGTYNDKLNMDTCSKCTSGKYSVISTSTSVESCITCPGGFSGEGFAQCDPCPLNSTANPGSGLLTDCKCDPGFTGKDGATCSYCLPGKFKPTNGSANCTDCPFDTYSNKTARTKEADCLDCEMYTQAPRGSDSRDDCKCWVGYTSSVPNVDGERCNACSTGKFKSTMGYTSCTNCPKDTYADTTGNSAVGACIPCFQNSTSGEGSVKVEDCLCVGGFERTTS